MLRSHTRLMLCALGAALSRVARRPSESSSMRDPRREGQIASSVKVAVSGDVEGACRFLGTVLDEQA